MRDLSSGECTSSCRPGLLSLDSRWCIEPNECRARQYFTLVDDATGGQCVAACPAGYRTHALNLTCTPCPDRVCKRDCRNTTFHLKHAHDFASIRNCVRVKRLVIEIQSSKSQGDKRLGAANGAGGRNTKNLDDLESSLAYLEEIDDYLLVTRNRFLTTLRFLSRLRVIRGLELFEKKYALFVHTNPRLRSLWTLDTIGLRLEHGSIKFFENPQLCFQHAEKLVMDVIKTSNRQELEVELSYNYNGYQLA